MTSLVYVLLSLYHHRININLKKYFANVIFISSKFSLKKYGWSTEEKVKTEIVNYRLIFLFYLYLLLIDSTVEMHKRYFEEIDGR